MTKISSEQVRAEVARFWGAFSSKSPEILEDFYSHEATVFSSSASRAEPGRLAVTRRKREYFNPQTAIRVQLGAIEVHILNDTAAVASYNFEFHASRVSGALGRSVEVELKNARATQVFVHESDGRFRIVHEHISSSAPER